MEMGTFRILIFTSGVLSETDLTLIAFRLEPNILLAATREGRLTGEFRIQRLFGDFFHGPPDGDKEDPGKLAR